MERRERKKPEKGSKRLQDTRKAFEDYAKNMSEHAKLKPYERNKNAGK